MKRLVEQSVDAWVGAKRRKPLVIRGARQVGKTWLVENYLAKRFKQVVKIDLEKRRDLHSLFSENLEPDTILKQLELEAGRIQVGQTLLFFDEIQACPRTIMALRYFYEQKPELHVVAAGSLLEFAFGSISVPVGRIQYLQMHPMTFYEYLWAIGNEIMAEHVLTHPSEDREQIQGMILKELRNYFFVGGMPECVKTYVETQSMVETSAVQTEILESYRDDFTKYTPQVDHHCLDAVLLNVAQGVGDQLKYARLAEGFTGKTNRKAFDLLTQAKVIHKIPACSPAGLPLEATANPKKFKAALLDIGLLQRLCQVPMNLELKHENLLAMYRGKLAEQYVAQELLAWHNRKLHYWSRDARSSNAEVDFLVVKNGDIYPIEVKSGTGGSLQSMHLLLRTYTNCPKGFILYSGPYGERPEQQLEFLPLYSVPMIVDRRLEGF